MLQIIVPGNEFWDEKKGEFIYDEEQTLNLEHSLVSISKWESYWKKPYFSPLKQKSEEETLYYLKCMTVNEVDSDIYSRLSSKNVKEISEYMENSMTATYLSESKTKGRSGEIITTELIYYWMVALTIPVEPYEHWHINRLLTFIEVCNRKNQPPKKMSRKALTSKYASLNAARKKSLNTRG